MSLVNELIKGLLPENEQREVAVYGGGFKPPTRGHFEVVKTALNKNPNIDKFIVLIGGKERDGISPDESLLIWDIYKKYLPISVEIQLSPKPPIQAVYNYAKNNPEELVLFVIGAREGNEEDFKDIASRTTTLDKYPNMRLETVITRGGVSGTAARNASKISLEKFKPFVPSELSDEEVEEVYNIVSNKVQEILTENASYSENINLKKEIAKLTKHMIDKGMNIQPLPKLVFKNGDSENAKQFLGKTAYYDPNSQSIVLYTEGRHPKDIVRSFSHEMVHHTQFLEDRLGNITTTNTQEDGDLDKLEQEANLKGTMTFRNWTDSLNENLTKNSNQIYHWTSYLACKKIIESNKLKSNRANQFFEYDESRILSDYENVVFFTEENERFADEENSNQCILVVDKSKLSKDYKTIPYGGPYEEIIVYTNDSFIPIFPYLKGVLLMNTLQKSGVKNLVQFLELKNIPYEINDNLEKQATAKKAMLPTLKKELINKLKSKYPNGFIGYLNSPLTSRQTPEYFKDNPTYSFPNITINKPGKYGEKNKFQIQFEIKPQNLEKYINWFMYSPDSIEDLINMDNYEGEELYLKGDIPIDPTTLLEANLKGTMTFRNWTDSLNEAIVGDRIKEAKEEVTDSMVVVLSRNDNQINLYNLKTNEALGNINTYGNEVTGVAAKKGYGPLMYELGMANIYPKGLQSDRRGNTEAPAEAVWKKYIAGASPNIKVEKLTPKDRDYRTTYAGDEYDSSYIPDFYNYKFYNPNTTTLKQLIQKGNTLSDELRRKIILDNDELYNDLVNEAIVGDKIECDNCDWSWDIVSGGNDLFVCHKCGHDNEPLEENKNKDPFGLNAYAMELGRLREEKIEYKIYVDMDGVVADFEQRFRDLAGMGPREFEEKYGKNAFWDFIDEGDNKLVFWVGIPPMSDAKQLIDYVSKYDYEMLTAPSLKKQSLMGKGLWMKNQTNKGLFPSKPKVNYKSAKNKKDFAAPNNILIDDREDTINSWNAAGGIGILHTSAANTISQLKKLSL